MDKRGRGILSDNEYKQPLYGVTYTVFIVGAVIVALIMLYPVFWVLSSALKSSADVYKVPPVFFPADPRWENFAKAWKVFDFPKMFANTILVYVGTVAIRLGVILPAAYALARLEVPFRRGVYLSFLATLMLPTAAILVPSYLVIINLRLYDSWWAVWLPAAAASMPLLLAKGFFDEIPKELSEASRIDGASDLRILGSVILPNSKPIVAVMCIQAFLEIWNAFLWQRLVLDNPKIWTLPVKVYRVINMIGGNPEMNVQLAAMFLCIIPPFILFVFFQKYITEGITLTGLKG
jgi:multiple sugar transport system permease protein